MSTPCPYCTVPTEYRNQRFAGHLYNNHKKELLENFEKQVRAHINLKRPYLKISYKIKEDTFEKWLCFASGISCVSLNWMKKHNEKHKALGPAHLEMMQQLINDKEKIMTTEPVSNAGNKELLDRIKQLEKDNAMLRKDKDDFEEMAKQYERETKYTTHAIKIYNELLGNFYRRDGFNDMYKAVEGYMNLAYEEENYNKETGEYDEEAIRNGEEEARSIKYDYAMYLGERPKSKEVILEEFCYDNDLDINNYRY